MNSRFCCVIRIHCTDLKFSFEVLAWKCDYTESLEILIGLKYLWMRCWVEFRFVNTVTVLETTRVILIFADDHRTVRIVTKCIPRIFCSLNGRLLLIDTLVKILDEIIVPKQKTQHETVHIILLDDLSAWHLTINLSFRLSARNLVLFEYPYRILNWISAISEKTESFASHKKKLWVGRSSFTNTTKKL